MVTVLVTWRPQKTLLRRDDVMYDIIYDVSINQIRLASLRLVVSTDLSVCRVQYQPLDSTTTSPT